MKIGINARYLGKVKSGIQYYILNLIKALIKIDKYNDYLLFLDREHSIPQVIVEKKLDYERSIIPTSNQILKIIWEHFYLPERIWKHKLNVFHGPAHSLPIIKTCPSITTIHDL